MKPITSNLVAPATNARRRFRATDLKPLGRENLAQLWRALAAEAGWGVPTDWSSSGDHDDSEVVRAVALRPRRVKVRVLYRPATAQDVDDLHKLVVSDDLAEALLVQTEPATGPVPRTGRVDVVTPSALIELLERSAFVAWPDGKPTVDVEALSLSRATATAIRRFDTVGHKWLTALAYNKVPPDARGLEVSAERLLEEYSFRILTMSLRFGGFRLGVRIPGQVAPDAIVAWAEGAKQRAALVDMKAARDGYRMGISDVRALRDYVTEWRPKLKALKTSLDYVIVVSGAFAGSNDGRHPYFGRRKELRASSAVGLVYLRAEDLVRTSLAIDDRGLTTREREAIRWSDAFDVGRPGHDALLRAVPT